MEKTRYCLKKKEDQHIAQQPKREKKGFAAEIPDEPNPVRADRFDQQAGKASVLNCLTCFGVFSGCQNEGVDQPSTQDIRNHFRKRIASNEVSVRTLINGQPQKDHDQARNDAT
jgi:hypothetical protein